MKKLTLLEQNKELNKYRVKAHVQNKFQKLMKDLRGESA